MSLRLQLLALGLITLLLPWAGIWFVQEMEAALRDGLEATLQGGAATVAAAVEQRRARNGAEPAVRRGLPGAGRTVYAHALLSAPQLDGRRDDWRLGERSGLAIDGASTVWAGTSGAFAYLFVEVEDQALVYQPSPGSMPYGDRVVLLVEPVAGEPQWLVLLTSAPGAFRAQYTTSGTFVPAGRFEDRVVGAWQESRRGFSVETRVPLSLVGASLGVAVIDVDPAETGYSVGAAASWDLATAQAGRFVHRREELQSVLEQLARPGDRLRLTDDAGWILADTGGITRLAEPAANGRIGLAERFFRAALRRDDPPYSTLEQPPGRLADPALRSALEGAAAVAWYRDGPDDSAIVAAAAPVRDGNAVAGTVLLEQASDPILTVTNQALLRLVTLTASFTLAAVLGLLAYASLLSFRVRRLARATETALGPEGEINVALPGGAARDEIGDLTRSFGDLLGRLRDYTLYLRTLTSKLTHELRTPLAIVSTSLDNLEHETREPRALPYLQRLRDGAQRLDAIVVAMSAATRIEQAIEDAVSEEFSLDAVAQSCAVAYADLYPHKRVVFASDVTQSPVRGSSDLVAQLLDKLVENAASFAPDGAAISIGVAGRADAFVLSVSNEGPPLPGSMRHQLFDSLVSVRSGADGSAHLGLGLYVVALIAKFHGASVEADNLADGSGVVFRVAFPRER